MSELMNTPRANGLAKSEQPQQPAIQRAGYGKTGVIFNSWAELWSFATVLVRSGMAPKSMTTEGAAVALQLGAELGLPPMAAIQNIAVINGRPSLWGDAQLAVCRATGELEAFAEWYQQGGTKVPRNPTTFNDDTTAVCVVKRRGMEPMESAFSVADAKRAKLWNKTGPWQEYPHRMLRNRARSYALRDTFGDALRGLLSSDEVSDTPYAVTSASMPTGSLDLAIEESQEAPRGEVIEHVEPTHPEPGEIPNEPEAAEAKEAPAPELDPAAKTWESFVEAAAEVAKARKIDPEFFDGAIKAIKMNSKVAARPTHAGHEFRSDWLGKFANGGKLGTDGALS